MHSVFVPTCVSGCPQDFGPWRDLQEIWEKAMGMPACPKWGSCQEGSLMHSSRMQIMFLCPYSIKRFTKCSQVFWSEQGLHSPFLLVAGFPFCTVCWLSPPSPSCSSGWDIRRAVCGPGQLLIHACSRRNWGFKEKVSVWSGTYFSWYQKCLAK